MSYVRSAVWIRFPVIPRDRLHDGLMKDLVIQLTED